MTAPEPAAIDRRALALIERLVAHPGDLRFRRRLLGREAPEIVARVQRLERASGLKHRLLTGMLAADPGAPAPPPERFGPFRITGLIGRGGMGEVWKGERDDGLYDQIVAVKLAQSHLPVKAGAAFANERRMLARLDHPDIARLIDGGTTGDGRACFVMEFVDGVPFDEACTAQPLRVRLDLFLKAALAVGYAHGKFVAHGDLKPSNILVDADGRVRLLDFGIARIITDDPAGFGLPGVVTSGFASPERLRGEPPAVLDDVFALGRILQIVLPAGPPPELAAIAARATAERETDRYAGVADLVADIRRFQTGEPVAAVAQTAAYRVRKYVLRYWKSLAAMALLTVATGIAIGSYVRADRSRQAAQRRFDDTYRLSRYMIFDLYDVLAAIPGTTRAREGIALESRAYLARLADTPDAPLGLRLDLARGYLRLAEVQGLSGDANLGKSRSAVDDILRARRILTPLFRTNPSDARVRTAMATALTMWSRSLIYLDHDPARALTIARLAEKVLRVDGTSRPDPAGRRALWAARVAEGDTLTWLDRPREALALLRESMTDGASGSAAIEDRRLVVRTLHYLGEAEFYAGDFPGAVGYLRQGARDAAAVVRSTGDRPSDVVSFIDISQSLGEAAINAGRLSDSVATLTAAAAAARRLLAFDPADRGTQKRLLSVEGDLSTALIAAGRSGEAAALIDRVRTGYLVMLKTDAGNPALVRAYARSIRPAGDLARAQGRSAEACAWFRRADDAWRAFDRRWGASASDEADDMASVKAALSTCR